MRPLTTTLILILASAAGCKGKSAAEQCEAIYQKGDGSAPYTTDKAKFVETCSKVSETALRCLAMKAKDKMKDDACGPTGSAFDEQMQIMKLGQGTP